MIPPLSFTEADSIDAHRNYGANCGPHALAAASGVSLVKAIEAIPDFIKKRYTNPTMMTAALQTLNVRNILSKHLHVHAGPVKGVARIQWEGRWLRSGVPPLVAYGYTHWIASYDDYVFCTAAPGFGWLPFSEWKFEIAALCARQNYDGWHVTHQYLFL